MIRKRNAGELLLRLTYKAYVEDEEEEGVKAQVVSEDDSSDADEPDLTYQQMQEARVGDKDRESFMDVLAALIVSEEFQGIVTSETGNPKFGDNVNIVDITTSKRDDGLLAESVSSGVDSGGESKQGNNISCRVSFLFYFSQLTATIWNFVGSVLFWLAVVTSIAVVIALNVGGSGIFNP